jgi:hypothetical protein
LNSDTEIISGLIPALTIMKLHFMSWDILAPLRTLWWSGGGPVFLGTALVVLNSLCFGTPLHSWHAQVEVPPCNSQQHPTPISE